MPSPGKRGLWGLLCITQKKSTSNNEFALTLKLIWRVIHQSPKQSVPVAPQNGPWTNKKTQKESYHTTEWNICCALESIYFADNDHSLAVDK